MDLVTSSFALTSTALKIVALFVVGLTILVLILSFIVFVHHIWSDRERRLNRERFEGAATFLAPYLVVSDDALEPMVAKARAKYGDRGVSLVLRRARFDLKGPVAAKISLALVHMGAVDQLIADTRSRRDWKRIAGARGLGECGGEKSRGVLMDLAMNDPLSEVRRAAREGLLVEHSQQAVQVAIASFLKDLPRRAGWRRSFYARLAAVSASDLLDLIRTHKLSAGEEKLALEALGDAGASEALELAISVSESREPELRATGIRVAGKLGGASELSLVIRALEDDAWFVRASAARSLEWMFGGRHIEVHDDAIVAEACQLLGDHLPDGSWWVRANAARALARSGQRGAAVLFGAAEGKDRYARDAALAALAMADLTEAQGARLRAIVGRLNVESVSAARPTIPQPGGVTA